MSLVSRFNVIAGAKSLVTGVRSTDGQRGLSLTEVIAGAREVEDRYQDLNFFDAGGELHLHPRARSVKTIRIELHKTEHLHLASVLIDADQTSDATEQPSVSVSSCWEIYRDALAAGLLFDPNNREIAVHTKRDTNPWIEIHLPEPADINHLMLRNRNDARSVRARGILVSARTVDGRWTTLYDGALRERQFARDAERNFAVRLLAKQAASRFRHRTDSSFTGQRFVPSSWNASQSTMVSGDTAADVNRLLTSIRLQDLKDIHADLNNLDLPDNERLELKSLINSRLLAPRKLEWNIHSVRKTFRFWSVEEKQHYIDFALSVIECLKQLNLNVCFGFGSVLSIVRDHDLIPHDDDLDIIIGFEPSQAETLAKALTLIRTHLNNAGFAAYGNDPANLNVRDRTNFKKLDVFVGIFEDGKIAWYPGKRGSLTRDMMFPPRDRVLLDRECPVPRDPEGYLEVVYGPSWKTPDANFQHQFSRRRAEYESIEH